MDDEENFLPASKYEEVDANDYTLKLRSRKKNTNGN